MSKDGLDTASLISMENSHFYRTALYAFQFLPDVIFRILNMNLRAVYSSVYYMHFLLISFG